MFNNFSNLNLKSKAYLFFACIFLFGIISIAYAIDSYTAGEAFTIGEFVYDDDYVGTTTPCTISIWGPAETLEVNEIPMIASTTGWHYYVFSGSTTVGIWPAVMTCGTAGVDLVRQDKTFKITSASGGTGATASENASAVWASSTRTLTSFGTLVSDIASAVWASSTRTITAFGNLAADVWNNTYASTRRLTDKTLTGGGNLATESYIDTATSTIITNINALNNISASDVWAVGVRKLSSGGNDDVASAVWASSSRTMTSGSAPSAGEVASAVWASSTRTLTNNGNDITADDVASAVWASSSRSLTDYSTTSISNAIWNRAALELTNSGSIGKRIVDNLDATISSRGTSNLTAGDVWSSITRTLTESTDPTTSAIASAVWASSSRTLTNYGNDITAEDVWNVLASSVSTANSIGLQLKDNANTTTIATAVWDNPTRSLTTFGTLINDIWSYGGGRTLTAFGNLAADVWNNTYASTRRLTDETLTGGGSIATKSYLDAATSTLLTEINDTQTLINNLNDISATDIWSYGARTVTGGDVDLTSTSTKAIWDIAKTQLTTSGSVGKQIVDNLDATISSRGTSNLTAGDVWSSVTRTLTDYSTSSIASASALAVWANAGRTLTDYGNNITASDVWNVLSSSLTTEGTIGKQLQENSNTSTIATAVWNSPTRTLSSFGTLINDIWSYGGGRTLTALGSIASDVWNNSYASTRRLTDQTLTGGGNLATESYINTATTTIINEIIDTQTQISALNNISAADVWAAGTRTLTSASAPSASEISSAVWSSSSRSLTDYSTSTISNAIWNRASLELTSVGSIGKQLADNLDAQVSTVGGGNLTAADIWSYANRALTDYSTSTIASAAAAQVWANSTRSLTNYGNNLSAGDVWNTLVSSLTTENSIGKLLNTNIDATISSRASSAQLNTATSTLMTEILNNQTLINNLNDISATDVWAAGTRTLTDYSTSSISSASADAVWNKASAQLSVSGSIGKQLADNLDAQVSTVGGGNLTAADIWSYANRALTDYSTTTISNAIWANASRTLTNYGNNITASDVWNVLTSALTTDGSIGKMLNTNIDTTISSRGTSNLGISDLANVTSTIIAEILTNRTLINNLNDISATDVWAAGTRTLTDYSTSSISSASADAVWNKASAQLTLTGTIGKQLADNLDAQVSTVGGGSLTAADIWAYANRTLTDYSTSTIASAIWSQATRTLTNYGNDITASDVWNVLTSSLATADSIGKLMVDNLNATITSRASLTSQNARWDVLMTGPVSVQTGNTYRAKIFVFNATSSPVNPYSTPTITLYDSSRNIIVSSVAMTNIDTGVYEYTYSVPSSAAQGVWESIISTQVESGKTITNNDYWEVAGSPAQVIINSVTMSAISTPNVSANLTITNEGLAGYEYHYEWCIVSNSTNQCGGNDDVYYGTGAKYINPSEDWNTNLTGSVTVNGTYYFKVIVYFGTDKSGSSRTFTASGLTETVVTPPSGGGGGGGGGGGASIDTVITSKNLPTQSGQIVLNAGESGEIKATTNQGIMAELDIPKNALSSTAIVYIKPILLSASNVQVLPPANQLTMLGSMVFDIQASNKQTSFSQPMTIEFNYKSADVKDFIENTLKIYWYDQNLDKWNPLDTKINMSKNTLTATVDHFTIFAIFGEPSGKSMSYNKSDFNHDNKVNSVDFSILLSFWNTKYPFANPLVDINNDKKVNSVDFSILLSQWGK